MDLKDFTNLGDSIGRRVNDAINSMNFDQLDRDIKNQVNDAFSGKEKGNRQYGGLNGKLYRGPEKNNANPGGNTSPGYHGYKNTARYTNTNRSGNRYPTNCNIPVMPNPPGRVSGIIFMITGYTLAGGFGIAAIIMGVLSATMSALSSLTTGVLGALTAGFIPLFAGGLVLAVIGTKRYGRVSRFKKYLSILNGEKFFSVKEFAAKLQKSPRFVSKDLDKMIERSYFLEGHLDDQKTCFIGTDEMYRQYMQARDSVKTTSQPAAEPQAPPATDAELDQVIAEGRSYIKTIQEANDAIYNAEISEKLFRMESIIRRIFDYVKENPDQISHLRKFMSYYMPTTEKLVNAYRDMDNQTIQGENITKAKTEIAHTLDTINDAYEKLYDSMYMDVAMDVSSDIAVLKTLFAQEGLSDNKMNGGK